MRSSISSSNSLPLLNARVLVGIYAILILAFEVLSTFLANHYSQTYVRVSRQYAEAITMRPGRAGEPASVLMVGNSLLMEGVDIQHLEDLMPGRMHIYPIFLEASSYYDWIY